MGKQHLRSRRERQSRIIHVKHQSKWDTIVQRANDNWGWLSRFNYAGYGRMVTRAIRGTSLDTFERW